MTILISILIGLALILVCLKEKRAPYGPLILRILIVVLLILALLKYRISWRINQKPKIPVLVLVDNSQSMIGKEKTVNELIQSLRNLPVKTAFFTFSDTISPLKAYNPIGAKTDIAGALTFAISKRPGAVVLITDGLHNQPSDPLAIAQKIPFPIYPIGIDEALNPDLYIEDLSTPSQGYLNDTLKIALRIGNHQVAGHTVDVLLKEKNQVIEKKTVNIINPNTIEEIEFTLIPKTEGRHTYQIEITPTGNETNLRNNFREFSINVFKNRYHVIYLTHTPSFNTRFILEALRTKTEALYNLSVSPYIAFVGTNYQSFSGISLADAAKTADLIILDDPNEGLFTPEIKVVLNELLIRKKGFLILAQENFSPGKFLKEILPAEYLMPNIIKRDLSFNLTSDAQKLPIFFTKEGEFLLSTALPFLGANIPSEIKKDAVAWLYNQELNLPLMSYRRFQGSKIVLINGFPIFRLGFSGKNPEITKNNFAEFISNLLIFLALPEPNNFTVSFDRKDYLVGERIKLNLQAITDDGRIWPGLSVWAEIPDFQVQFPFYELKPGIYQGECDAQKDGNFLVKIKINRDTLLVDTLLTSVIVSKQTIEDLKGLNIPLLTKIAELSGGKYFTSDQITQLPVEIKIRPYQRILTLNFYNNPILYILMVILLSLMILLRKRYGLL